MNKFVRFGTLGIVIIIMSACSEVPKVSSEVSKTSDALKVSSEVSKTSDTLKVSSEIPKVNFANCTEHSVPMPGTNVLIHDCPTVIDLGEIKIFRFTKMNESIVNVAAYAADGNRPIVSVPDKAAPVIVQYGSQRYAKISMLLPPNAPIEEWTKQGWEVKAKGTTGVMIMYTKH